MDAATNRRAMAMAPPSVFGEIPLGSSGARRDLAQPEVLAWAEGRPGLPSLPDCVRLVCGRSDLRISVNATQLNVVGQTARSWIFAASRRTAARRVQTVAVKCLWTQHRYYEPELGVADLIGRESVQPIARLRVRAKDLPSDFPLQSGWFESQLRALQLPRGDIHGTISRESEAERRTITDTAWITRRAWELGAPHRTDGQPGTYVAFGGRDYEHPSLLIIVTPLRRHNVRRRLPTVMC